MDIFEKIRKYFNPRDLHSFDLDSPRCEDTNMYRLNNENGELQAVKVTGYECKKCGRVLWLDLWDMKRLPKSMRYCEP